MSAPATDTAARTDAELAIHIATGKPAAAAETELCRRFVSRLVAFGRRRLGSADRGHDLAQDTLLLVIQKLRAGEVRDPERIGSFILGVARFLSSGERSRAQRYQPLDDATRDRLAVDLRHPDPIASSRVRGCLEALPDVQRTVVMLTFYAEESSGDIAGSLGLSPQNVRVIRHRGVARLRDCLGVVGRAA